MTGPTEVSAAGGVAPGMKKIGFLSFGHWSQSQGSQTRTAADALLLLQRGHLTRTSGPGW